MPRAKRTTTIEINGHIYDAATGKLLQNEPTNTQHKSKVSKRQPDSQPGTSIDGFVNPNQPATAKSKAPASEATTNAPQTKREPRKATHVHQPTRKSRTLNRSAVVPPPANIQAVAPPKEQSVSRHALAAQVHASRKARAAGVAKSPHISRYGVSGQDITGETPSTPEHEQPEENMQPPAQSLAATAPPVRSAALPAPAREPQQEPIRQSEPSAGNEPFFKRAGDWVASKRMSSLVATSLAAVLLIGYVTYVNIPRIALRVAASRAGFEAQMPGYNPSGFSFSGPVAYAPGQITVKYDSNTDERQYTITQRETNWDSQTLLDNHVLEETELYSTYQERGLTVYVYDGSTASWVNGGIWYTVSGDSELTAEQLLKIAASL